MLAPAGSEPECGICQGAIWAREDENLESVRAHGNVKSSKRLD